MCGCEDRPCCGCDSETYSIYEGDFQPKPLGADRPLGCAQSNYDVLKRSPEISRINVLPLMYNRTMKKNKKPLSKTNNAIRKAHSAELFRSLLLSPHLVETPATRKGSRQSNKRKAIAEHQ